MRVGPYLLYRQCYPTTATDHLLTTIAAYLNVVIVLLAVIALGVWGILLFGVKLGVRRHDHD